MGQINNHDNSKVILLMCISVYFVSNPSSKSERKYIIRNWYLVHYQLQFGIYNLVSGQCIKQSIFGLVKLFALKFINTFRYLGAYIIVN